MPCIPQPLPNSASAPDASGTNSIAISAHPSEPSLLMLNNVPLVLCNNWQNLVTGNIDQALATDPSSAKSAVVDYQNFSLTYSTTDLSKNKHQLDMTDRPNAVLQWHITRFTSHY